MLFDKLVIATVAAYASAPAAAESVYDLIAANPDEFSTLDAAIEAADLVDALSDGGPFTIFGPVNSAFAELPAELLEKLSDPVWLPQLQDLLLFHGVGSILPLSGISDGQTETTLNGHNISFSVSPGVPNDYVINNSSSIIIVEENEAVNGILHPIDAVLVPASVTDTVVDIASSTSAFSTLVTAITAAGLVETLSGDGPFTIFAPTNEAFDRLPEGTVDALLLPENLDILTEILTYHTIAANAVSSSLTSGDVETLNGASVEVVVSDADITVNGANVITPDIIANNGILHAIDTVLLPPETEAPTNAPTMSMSMTMSMPMDPTPSPSSYSAKSSKSKSSKSSKASKASKKGKRSKGKAKKWVDPRGPFH